MRSMMNLSVWRGDITMFAGFTKTRPSHEEAKISAGRIADLIAPEDGPLIVAEKEHGGYFMPCSLRVAPLVGKTLEWAIRTNNPTIGKMRSNAHVTAGAWVKLDGDGLTEAQYGAMLATLKLAGVGYLVYSTHSHGRADKPGIRCRVVLFLDRALEPADYQRATASVSNWLFGKSMDESEARLSQQAGTWCAHPDRVAKAFCIRQLAGYCLSADALLAAAPQAVKPRLSLVASISKAVEPIDPKRVRAALAWITSNDYDLWIKCAIWLRAAYGDGAYPVWLAWSMTADESCRADEGECERVWAGLSPSITPGQGAGALYATARDESLKIAKAAAMSGQWKGRGTAALVYLKTYHGRIFAQTFHEVAA